MTTSSINNIEIVKCDTEHILWRVISLSDWLLSLVYFPKSESYGSCTSEENVSFASCSLRKYRNSRKETALDLPPLPAMDTPHSLVAQPREDPK